jgi:ectoine hydroxylase-related dioxygenase (phytanoyl-CoA dioxygenase family)
MYGRVVPTAGNEDAGYLGWHQDHAQPDDECSPSYRNVKLFVYLWGVPRDGGETAVVPGTHRVAGSPSETFVRPEPHASGAALPFSQASMPNLVRMTVAAGTAMLFDSSIWHTAMPNTSGAARRCCHASYRSSECAGADGRTPSWGPRAGLSEATLRRLAAAGKLGLARRRLLGLPDAGTGEAAAARL